VDEEIIAKITECGILLEMNIISKDTQICKYVLPL